VPNSVAASSSPSGPLITIGSIDARGHDDAAGVAAAIGQVMDRVAAGLRDQSLRGLTGVAS
jgi:hypothetical protein